jgi:hypothetical protein
MKPRTNYFKSILIIFVVLFSFSTAHAQEYFEWRWDYDPIMKDVDASAMHFVGCAQIAGITDNFISWYKADLLTFGLGVAWEIKDAWVPYELAGQWGAQGFGINDLKLDLAGIITNRIFTLFWNKLRYGQWRLNDDSYWIPRNSNVVIYSRSEKFAEK